MSRNKGNTAQSPPDGFARNLRADFPSYCPEIPFQTYSLPAEFLGNLPKNLTTHLTYKLCAVLPKQRQYCTKSVWRLCTPSACKFPVIFHKNAREYIQYSLRFLFHLTKNLTTHLSHNLCAVLPRIISNRAMRVRFSSRIIFPRRDFHGRYSVFFQRSRRTAL